MIPYGDFSKSINATENVRRLTQNVRHTLKKHGVVDTFLTKKLSNLLHPVNVPVIPGAKIPSVWGSTKHFVCLRLVSLHFVVVSCTPNIRHWRQGTANKRSKSLFNQESWIVSWIYPFITYRLSSPRNHHDFFRTFDDLRGKAIGVPLSKTKGLWLSCLVWCVCVT